MKYLADKLDSRLQNNSFRRLEHRPHLIDFFSNDYLGLARNKDIFNRSQSLINHSLESGQANGSTGSRLLSGNSEQAEALENKLSKIFNGEKALLLNSGYNANLSVLSSVPQKGDTIISDEFVHASLKDGARLSFAKRLSFKHNNLEDLKQKLLKSEGKVFVVVESIYSMDGDFAPLKDIAELCEYNNACLVVDEAHSTGIYGKNGSGLACQLELEKKIFARIYTFGKAIGHHGACVVGSNLLIDYLINFARPFIYTTALPLHSLYNITNAFDYLSDHPELSQVLFEKTALFRNKIFSKLNPDKHHFIYKSCSAIQALHTPGNKEAKHLAGVMEQNGFDARAILSPTVKAGCERLRICIHTFNTDEDIDLITTIICDELNKTKT